MGIRTAIRGRVYRMTGKAFRIDITGRGARLFKSAAEFQDFLERNKTIDAADTRHFARLGKTRLEREILRTEKLYRGLLDTLILVTEGQRPEYSLWRDLDIGVVPDEAHWPAILFACNFNETLPSAWRRLAVEAFLEYLRQRKQTLRETLLKTHGSSGVDAQIETDEFDLEEANAWLEQDMNKLDSITRAAMTRERNYRRLPYDMPVSVTLDDGARITLYLARWKIALQRQGRSLSLIEDQAEIALQPGKNSVGRGASCDAALLKAPMDVSRTHLIVDWRGKGELVIRDVSMKGSWLPRDLLEGVNS